MESSRESTEQRRETLPPPTLSESTKRNGGRCSEANSRQTFTGRSVETVEQMEQMLGKDLLLAMSLSPWLGQSRELFQSSLLEVSGTCPEQVL